MFCRKNLLITGNIISISALA